MSGCQELQEALAKCGIDGSSFDLAEDWIFWTVLATQELKFTVIIVVNDGY